MHGLKMINSEGEVLLRWDVIVVLKKCLTGAGNGVKRREMAPKMVFLLLKSDFHHTLY